MAEAKKISHSPFLAFAGDAKDMEALKAFASAHNLPESSVMQGDIKTAVEFLKTNASPTLLLVEIASAAEAQAQLDALAAVCDPDTKVIVIGSINEYSFYCWLTEIGISSYLLRPITVEMLEGAYAKSTERPMGSGKPEKAPAKTIAVIGARGGVGASTVALNLAGIIADQAKKSTGLIDLDPHEGTLALTLDIEPSRGVREALEKPDRIDSLFIDRVMTKLNKHLSLLSSEESIQERFAIHEQAADLLLKELKDKFEVLVLDVPRNLTPFTRGCLSQADHVVIVAELTLASLRDTLRVSDLMRESLKMRPPVVVANRKGMTKHDMKPADFEKGINGKIGHLVAFAADVFMPVTTDIPAIKFKTAPAAKELYKLAAELVPEAKSIEIGKEAKKLGGMFKKKKAEEETPEAEEKESKAG